MGPAPYSERSVLPRDSSNSSGSLDSDPTQITSDIAESLSATTTPSPTGHDFLSDVNLNALEIEEDELNALPSNTAFYPGPVDSMPFDHAFPAFLRQLTNERNLANVQSLKVRVISRLVSLHRMSLFTTNLRELDLEGSILGSLRDIGCNLKFLQILKVGNCQLDSLDGTFGLTSLKRLFAQRNQIVDVSPCSNLPHVQHIDVSYNRIRNVSYAGFLSVCRKLKSIVFTGNPATQLPDYRNHVKNLIPQLKSLDNMVFGSEDSEVYAEADEHELYRCEFDGEFSQEDQSDICNNTFDESNSLTDNAEESEKNVPMKTKTQKYDSDTEDMTKNDNSSVQGRDFNLLNLRRERDEDKQLKRPRQCRRLSVNIEETEDLVENNLVHNSYQGGDFNNGITLPPLNTTEREFKKHSEKGSKNKSEIHEKSDSFSSVPDFEKTSTSDFDTLITGVKSRTSARLERPYTASSSVLADSSTNHVNPVRKRPCTAGSEPSPYETEDPVRNVTQRDLTSGLPICGNLAVALRNRKKLQERDEIKIFKPKEM